VWRDARENEGHKYVNKRYEEEEEETCKFTAPRLGRGDFRSTSNEIALQISIDALNLSIGELT
jgi:hypothetical protein